jgi:hypothetical protein
MAYAFEKIQNLLDTGKQNIFDPSAQGQSFDSQNALDSGQMGEMKTEAGGDVSSGSSTSASSPKQSLTQSQASTASQKAYEASQNQPSSNFRPIQDLRANLQKSQQDLQNEANSYTQAQRSRLEPFKVDQSTLEKGVAGDEASAKKIKDVTLGAPVAAEAFKPQTKTDWSEIQRYQSEPGLTGYFRSVYGPSYSRGQAALDVGRLQRDPGFQTEMRSLQGNAQDLQNQLRNYQASDTGLQAQANTELKTGFENQKKAIEDYLAKQAADLEASQVSERDRYLADLKRLQDDPNYRRERVQGQLSDPAIDAMIKETVAANPQLGKYLTREAINAFGIDPVQFIKLAGGDVDASRFYDENEAAKFNRLMGLMGRSGSKVAGAPLDPLASLDVGQYGRSILDRATSANASADEAANRQIQSIQNALAERARGYETEQNQFNYDQLLNNLALNARGQLTRPGNRPDIENALSGIDPRQFFTVNKGAFNPMDFLNADEAGQLRSAYGELGESREFAPGRQQGGFRPDYSFNQQAYTKALQDLISQMSAPPPPPVPEPESARLPGWQNAPARAIETFVDTGNKLNEAGRQVVGGYTNLAKKAIGRR